jgi:hypothetical protein
LAYIDFQATKPVVRSGAGEFCLGNYESLAKGDISEKEETKETDKRRVP